MPRRSAAWMTVTPSSTSIAWPSISILGMGSQRPGPGSLSPAAAPRGPFSRLGAEGAATEGSVLLELGAGPRGEGAGRHGRAVGQGTDGVALDVVGHVEEEIDVRGRCPAVLEPARHAGEPAGP